MRLCRLYDSQCSRWHSFRSQHHPAHRRADDVRRPPAGQPRQHRDRHPRPLYRPDARDARLMATASLERGFLSSPEELIDEARNGRMFILVDDEDRENEGDLVIPAQMATPQAINFMATHGKGLICLAM